MSQLVWVNIKQFETIELSSPLMRTYDGYISIGGVALEGVGPFDSHDFCLPRDPIYAEEMIRHPNHHLRIQLDS